MCTTSGAQVCSGPRFGVQVQGLVCTSQAVQQLSCIPAPWGQASIWFFLFIETGCLCLSMCLVSPPPPPSLSLSTIPGCCTTIHYIDQASFELPVTHAFYLCLLSSGIADICHKAQQNELFCSQLLLCSCKGNKNTAYASELLLVT